MPTLKSKPQFPNCNLILYGKDKDVNGNSTVKVGFPNDRAFSIQTNGTLPETQWTLQRAVKEVSDEELEVIGNEVADYVKKYGSKAQKTKLKIYSNYKKPDWMEKGGNVDSRISVLEKAMNSPMASATAKKAFKDAIDKLKNKKAEGGAVDPNGDQPDWDGGDMGEGFPKDDAGVAGIGMGKGGSVTGSERNKMIYDYIIDAIDPSDYDAKAETDAEKIKFIWKTFNSKYGHEIKRYGQQKAFENWLQGLPSSFNVAYEYVDIIAIGKKWGYLPENATEKQEDNFTSKWWAGVYMGFRKAAKKNKVDLDTTTSMGKGGSTGGDKHKYFIKAYKKEKDYNASPKITGYIDLDSLSYEDAQKEQDKLLASKKYWAVCIHAKKDKREVSFANSPESKGKGGKADASKSVKITDNKSLFKGQTGVIVGETKKNYKVKVQDNGKDRVIEVNKRGAKMC
jgi:hypothetical protein